MDRYSQTRKVLMIGLDGYESSVGEKLMAAGELPALTRLRDRSARFLLDHGPAQRTGLSWEQVSSGRSPAAGGRWSAITFDPYRYEAWQEGTSLEPFPAHLKAPAVIFDAPYFDLDRAPLTRGLVNWGAHDPGVGLKARPESLRAELESRFGPYPAREWIYGIVWPSAERARKMGDGLAHATDLRAEAAQWLLGERLPDWQLGVVVTGELHSAIEGLWHGVDPTHPLHELPSAGPAGEGLRAVYRAVDRLVGRLTDSFDDAVVVTFAMGGMGPNRSDISSMVLLPELLYRHAFGRPLMGQPEAWANAAVPMIGEDENWSDVVNAQIHALSAGVTVPHQKSRWRHMRGVASQLFPGPVKRLVRRLPSPNGVWRDPPNWMPALHYQPYWPGMRFFALPSFYDGRIRINLAGREREGKVPLSKYAAVCGEVEDLVRSCRDFATGDAVVDYVERCGGSDPRKLGPSESDLVIVWRGTTAGFNHPALGRIGPVPYRRTGGHTGRFGMAYVSGEGIPSGDFGVRSSFDVVPTVINLLGESLPPGLSGRSLLALDGLAHRADLSAP